MEKTDGKLTCLITCWVIAAFGGLAAGGALMLAMGLGLEQSAFLGILVVVAVGIVLTVSMCGAPLPPPKSVAREAEPGSTPLRVGGTAAKAAPAAASATVGKKPKLHTEVVESPDDLKQIKGVGAGLEKALNEMGVYHFSQIAAWDPAEVAWVDENLVQFKGRASRDDWVDQAKMLAARG